VAAVDKKPNKNRPKTRAVTSTMGKKARTVSGKQRAALRKLNKKTLPEPPPPVEDEVRGKRNC
jgi:hypothetical protein